MYATKVLPEGVKFKVREENKEITDEDIIAEIWRSKVYTPQGFKIQKGFNVIDIGANIGSFTVYAAKAAKKGSVYSYEPYPENLKLLKENVRMNELKNVKIFGFGVMGKRKKSRLYMDRTNDGGHSVCSKSKDFITMRCVTLKGIFDANNISFCDFLKLDCEGAEYDILFNTPGKYLSRIGRIALECHKHPAYKKNNVNSLKKFLRGAGFQIKIKPVKSDLANTGMLYAKNMKATNRLRHPLS